MSRLTVSAYVKMFTGTGIQITRAMELTSKLFKTYNTLERLEQLTDANLCEIGITGKEERRQILNVVKKRKESTSGTKRRKLKRKREDDPLDSIPDQRQDEEVDYKSLDFNEVIDEDELLLRSTIVNRAPIMAAWAMVVAETLSFKREEALSIASAYTEMNAISKGISLGIVKKSKIATDEILASSNQPHVDLMGRRPLFAAKNGQWRALSPDGTPASPASAYSYITDALRQTLPYIVGAMRLLASSFEANELNHKGFGLYASFRPQVEKWGGRSMVRCKDILDLRKKSPELDQRPRDLVTISGTQ